MATPCVRVSGKPGHAAIFCFLFHYDKRPARFEHAGRFCMPGRVLLRFIDAGGRLKGMQRRKKTDPKQLDLFETQAAKLEQIAERFAEELRRAAKRAKKEEDIRAAVVGQLAIIGKELNVRIEAEHEYTLLKGQIDSVYGSVFVEYKNPAGSASRLGPNLSSPGTLKVIGQIDRRFADVATQTGRTGAPMLGIGCDGRYFVFRRFLSGHISPEEPVEVSRWMRGDSFGPSSTWAHTDPRLHRSSWRTTSVARARERTRAFPPLRTLYTNMRASRAF